MNFDANNPVLDKRWEAGDSTVVLSNRTSDRVFPGQVCEPFIRIEQCGVEPHFMDDAAQAVKLANALLIAASELQRLETPAVYLLWEASFENRSGEDFCRAFVGLPDREQLVKSTGPMSNMQYESLIDFGKEVTINTRTFWLELQE